ncbi:uncharacterized protein ASPGLDRAFT_137506 [Aspergillus glaucus CBS 516.65]|uniref:Uncharacterized protein n=1 Tax=Aspergillus glaucus CBS 516.65 TaxID=1160497 RepID=A0A1L9V5D4_ASPGL|nr:hypothetical protein ASPGLDRAFT_137506 [Aspergillus glaucus CBS 516.65]OJJ79116.1 hypothetical protein ASPGLDRAFT_137506 [Aspergillus glaucus CBS 516.65]
MFAEHELPPLEVSWLQRDVLLFANSIGVTAKELHFLHELHPRFMVFPTYPLILPFNLTDQEVIEFYCRNASNTIPGAPALDLRYAVDGQRELTIHRPLPIASIGARFELRNKVIGIYDKGKAGSAFETEQQIVNTGTDEVYTTTRTVSFVPKQGNWGGPRENESTNLNVIHIQSPKSPTYPSPNCAPDATHEVQITDNTIFLYRLNGDYNPLHAVPEPGLEMGMGGVIIHGLFTYSSTCHGVLQKIYDYDATQLKKFQARFASLVRPGHKLITKIWRMGITEGLEEVRFTTTNQNEKMVPSNSRALFLPKRPISNL